MNENTGQDVHTIYKIFKSLHISKRNFFLFWKIFLGGGKFFSQWRKFSGGGKILPASLAAEISATSGGKKKTLSGTIHDMKIPK